MVDRFMRITPFTDPSRSIYHSVDKMTKQNFTIMLNIIAFYRKMNQILGQTEKIIQPFFRCQYKGRILLLLNATNSNLKILETIEKLKRLRITFFCY